MATEATEATEATRPQVGDLWVGDNGPLPEMWLVISCPISPEGDLTYLRWMRRDKDSVEKTIPENTWQSVVSGGRLNLLARDVPRPPPAYELGWRPRPLVPIVGQHWGTALGPHLYIQAVSETYVEVRLFKKNEPMVPLFGRSKHIHRANWAQVVEDNKLILLYDR